MFEDQLLIAIRMSRAIGNAQAAREGCEAALAANPEWAAPQLELAALALATGDLASAELNLRRAIAVDPEGGLALAGLGSVLEKAGETREAHRLYQQALVVDPGQPEAWLGLSRTAVALGDASLGEAAALQAFARNPTSPEVALQLAAAQLELGRFSIAGVLLSTVVAGRPDDVEAWVMLGVALARQGAFDLAVAADEWAAGLTPSSATLAERAGVAAMRVGRHESAVQHLRRAASLDPGLLNAHTSLGLCLIELGLVGEAVDAQKAAIFNADGSRLRFGNGAPRFDRELAGRALLRVKDRLDAAGIRFFLSAGTLLGIVREGDFIAHDKDIDIGVFSDTPVESIVRALSADSEFRVVVAVDDPTDFSVVFRERMPLDFFRYVQEPDVTWCAVKRQGRELRWNFTPFDLAERAFLGTSFEVPADAERYLEEAYGDWRTPDPSYETFLASPNLAPGERELGLFYAYGRLLDAIIKGNGDGVRERARGLLSHDPCGGAFGDLLARWANSPSSTYPSDSPSGVPGEEPIHV